MIFLFNEYRLGVYNIFLQKKKPLTNRKVYFLFGKEILKNYVPKLADVEMYCMKGWS